MAGKTLSPKKLGTYIGAYRAARVVVELAASMLPPRLDATCSDSHSQYLQRCLAELSDALQDLHHVLDGEILRAFGAVNPFAAEVGPYSGVCFLEVVGEYGEDCQLAAFEAGVDESVDDESYRVFVAELTKRELFNFNVGLLEIQLYKEAVRVTGDVRLEIPRRPGVRSEAKQKCIELLEKYRDHGERPDYSAIAQRSGLELGYVRKIASDVGITVRSITDS